MPFAVLRYAQAINAIPMTASDLNVLHGMLDRDSNVLLRELGLRPGQAYQLMLTEPDFLPRWWCGAFEQSPEEEALIDEAARAYALSKPLPELSVPQRARLALRLRLASRILRAMSNRHDVLLKGWFPNKLKRLGQQRLFECLLVDTWRCWSEIFDETLLWADGVDQPPAPSVRRSPGPASSSDTSSLTV
jgi:hypothetical protein